MYSIDISVVDIWKRYSGSITLNSTTLSSNSKQSSQLFDHYLIEKSVTCYRLDYQLLLIEYNRSELFHKNSIYNLTIYDYQDHIVLTDNYYNTDEKNFQINDNFHSFIYRLKRKSLTYKIRFLFTTNQFDYIETIFKYCDDFYPIYSPLTCSIKSTSINNNHLMFNMQLNNYEKQIFSLKPTSIFYRTSRTHTIKKNIYEIHKVNFLPSPSFVLKVISVP